MAVETPTPQPEASELSGGALAVQSFNRALAEQPETSAEVDVPALSEAPQFDPAAIRIPDNAQLPRHAEKYKGKSLADVMELDLRTQQYASERAQEAARLFRENSELQARLAAADQVNRMVPQQPQTDDEPPEARFFKDPVAEVNRVARTIAAEEVRRIEDARMAERAREQQNFAAISAFETAKNKLRSRGHEISDDEWVSKLGYIAPAIDRENSAAPGILFNPDRYVEHYESLFGGPIKPELPREGNPPVPTRSSAPPPAQRGPTLSREDQQLNSTIRKALKLE